MIDHPPIAIFGNAFQCGYGNRPGLVIEKLQAGEDAFAPHQVEGVGLFRHAALPDRQWEPGAEPCPDPTPALAADLASNLITHRNFVRAGSDLADDFLIAVGCSKGLLRNLEAPRVGSVAGKSQGIALWPIDSPVSGMQVGYKVASLIPDLRSVIVNYPAACATGLVCTAMACEALLRGQSNFALAGSVEYTAYPSALASFRNLGALTQEACRPFDVNRSGFNTGDGGGMLLLGRTDAANEGMGSPLGWIAGWDIRSSSHHPTAAEPSGESLANSIQRTLKIAGWSPEEVDGICAHATGTANNDLAEARAIHTVFGSKSIYPPVFSFKGALGHLLGASSALELSLSIEILGRGIIPGNMGLQERDPDLPPINLPIVPFAVPNLRKFLKVALGFGGPIATMAVEINRANPAFHPEWPGTSIGDHNP